MSLIGQYIVSERGEFKSEGMNLDLEKAGITILKLMHRPEYFMCVGITKEFKITYALKYTNNVDDAI